MLTYSCPTWPLEFTSAALPLHGGQCTGVFLDARDLQPRTHIEFPIAYGVHDEIHLSAEELGQPPAPTNSASDFTAHSSELTHSCTIPIPRMHAQHTKNIDADLALHHRVRNRRLPPVDIGTRRLTPAPLGCAAYPVERTRGWYSIPA